MITARQIEVHAAVVAAGGHQARAAEALGVSRATVTRVLQTYERNGGRMAPRVRIAVDPRAYTTNLAVAAYRLTAVDIAEGRLWWPRAADEVAWLARQYDVPFRRLAHAAAALSPGLRWTATFEALVLLLDARRAGEPDYPRGIGHLTFGYRDRAKAWAILTTSADPTSLCRGPKVTAVVANLLGDLSVVAVDRHIVRAATGSDRRQVSPVSLRRIGDALALLAVLRGLRPAELQAALWVHGSRS